MQIHIEASLFDEIMELSVNIKKLIRSMHIPTANLIIVLILVNSGIVFFGSRFVLINL